MLVAGLQCYQYDDLKVNSYPIKFFTTLFVFLFLSLAINSQADDESIQELSYRSNDIKALELTVLSQQIEQRISTLRIISKSLASDSHIHAWVASGFPEAGEKTLLDKLGFYVNTYNLTSASFADKSSNKYWNHEGFLRVLDPKIDTWYFKYVSTGDEQLISIYHDKNKKRVDLYVNYQQVPGTGLSGVATSFDSVLRSFQRSNLTKNGNIFIVDKSGDIKVHPDIIFGRQTIELDDIITSTLSNQLPNLKATKYIEVDSPTTQYLIVAPIDETEWYVVFQPH